MIAIAQGMLRLHMRAKPPRDPREPCRGVQLQPACQQNLFGFREIETQSV